MNNRSHPEQSLSVDDLFEVLNDRRRREILHHLPGDKEAQIRPLSRCIAADEEGEPPSEVGEDAIQRVYIALYQSHLPVLEKKGLLEYDDSTGAITPLPLFKKVKGYLTLVGENPVDGTFDPEVTPKEAWSSLFDQTKSTPADTDTEQ